MKLSNEKTNKFDRSRTPESDLFLKIGLVPTSLNLGVFAALSAASPLRSRTQFFRVHNQLLPLHPFFFLIAVIPLAGTGEREICITHLSGAAHFVRD